MTMILRRLLPMLIDVEVPEYPAVVRCSVGTSPADGVNRHDHGDCRGPRVARGALLTTADYLHDRGLGVGRLEGERQVVRLGVDGSDHRVGVVHCLASLAESRYRVPDGPLPRHDGGPFADVGDEFARSLYRGGRSRGGRVLGVAEGDVVDAELARARGAYGSTGAGG